MIVPDPFPGWGTLGGEKMSLSIPESLKMCPKHGVAHGVCVDPIKAEIPPDREPPKPKEPHPKPNAAHYGLEPCDIDGCSWCAADKVAASREEKMGGLERLAVQWNPDKVPDLGNATAAQHIPCGTGGPVVNYPPFWLGSPDAVQPNRFDPYEALDTIAEFNARNSEDAWRDIVEEQVHALRAYITGMEK